MQDVQRFQIFSETGPGLKSEINISDMSSKLPVSIHYAQFDNVCGLNQAETLAGRMGGALDVQQVYTDRRGHTFFTESNAFSSNLQAEISIDAGEAKSLKATAGDYLRKTGGYQNPAADNEELNDGAFRLLLTWTSLGLLATVSLF